MEDGDNGFSQGGSFSAQKMDEERHKNISYQYLCHLEEAKKWVEACINEELPEAGELEEELRHGVYLAKLAHFFAPDTVPLRRIYDPDLSRYRSAGLTFRHTDNINHFLKALAKIKLPSIFYPETTDVYDRKNMPRVIFCLHALSLYLFRLGIAPQIQNLYGKVNFSEEVLQAMMAELNKYGCQLPQFGKIGGILASELPVDEATLHAAVIAVNDAIDKADDKELLETLCNTSCHLQHVMEDNADSYLQCLSDAKMHKKEMAVNKSRDQDYIPDAYDELLTQAEIQGHITYVNAFCALERVEDAVKDENTVALIQALNSSLLSLKGVRDQLSEEYLRALAEEIAEPKKQSGNQSFNCSFNSSLLTATLSKTTIQTVINTINTQAKRKQQLNCGLSAVNKSLESGSPSDTLVALKALGSHIPTVLDFAAPLYHEEMAAIREDAQCDLSLEEVQGGIRLLSAVARINAALDTNSPSQLWLYLSDTATHLQNMEKSHSREYLAAMIKLRQAKTLANELCPFLTYFDLQQLIDEVNEQLLEDNNKVGALTEVNRAVTECNVNKTMTALQHPALKLSSVCCQDALHYYQLLKVLCKAKCEMLGDSEAELWLEDIEEVVEAVGRHARESIRAAITLTALNKALAVEDDSAIIRVLRSQDLAHLRVKENHIPKAVVMLKEEYKERSSMAGHCSWVPYTLGDGSKVYLNVEEGRYQWERPEEMVGHRTSYITHQDLEKTASFIMQQEDYNKKLDHLIVRLQARARGWLIRQTLHKQQKAVISIQAWWRMVRAKRTYIMYCKALKLWEPYIIKLQRAVRAWLHRRRLVKLSQYFVKNVKQVVVIQRAWRAHKARQDLHSLTHQANPPLPVIKKFIHLLDVSPADLDEEFRLQRLKSDMVKTIRHTHHLESEVDELDVKIGLLVHNRITLQDVIPTDKENVNPNVQESKSKKSKKSSRDTLKCGSMRSQRGLKALKKDSRVKLLGYQHLFYLLQTQPRYLATLIFALPPGKTTKFIENVIFTLHNYGANDRDSYLLLKLFKTALEEEIRCKVLRLTDIVSGNPLVVKMIVSFNRRGGPGQASLRDMLGPLIHKVLSDNNMQINTNPVEIYKTWINQLEMNTGQASGLPYSVNQDQAMQYPEVQKRLASAITKLKEVTLAFCEQITSNRDLIPYAMLYMARVMRSALQRRFPHIPEKEILKVVGNLVYYRYINSAIVAPDAYDIVTVSPDEKLNNNQRRNLASIAKILQFAASKKGFGDEASHLQCLNPFIIECHEQFKGFFRHCCEVEEPEVVYNVTQYSEAMLIVKPTIYITVQEICETHQLLLDNEDILAPDSDDPLHNLLSELGERPSVHALVGENIDVETGTLGRMEVCLALTNKFEVTEAAEEKEPRDANKIFVRTKQLLVDVIRCVEGGVIGELVCGPTLPAQEEIYRTIVTTRAHQEHRARLNHTELNQSTSFQVDNRVSLHEVRTRLSHNLRRLENQGIVTRSNNYQAILNAIAADIVNQRQHRISRKAELQKMVATASQLEKKEIFYKEQLDSYHTYLKTCLANIAARNKNVHQAWTKQGGGEKARSKQAIKYTAVKLIEKGVLLEVEDLPDSQQKNLLFEITPLATTGLFHVQAKFMGVPMENVEIDIQELLQLQYEGVSVKKMFSKVKVNVNLLLHLLNTKFYSKK